MESSVDLNCNMKRVQVDIEWFQIPVWATKNNYEIRSVSTSYHYEAYDPNTDTTYFPKDEE